MAESGNQAFPPVRPETTDLAITGGFLSFLAITGVGVIAVWATRYGDDFGTILGITCLMLGASALVGGFLGFLFGIPKSAADPGGSGQIPQSAESRLPYAANTNLEQISDWLTKIIVGVSLTQLGPIRDQFLEVARFGGRILPGRVGDVESYATTVTALVLVYGLITGFMTGYLMTRMFLPGAFGRADEAMRKLKTEKQEAETKLEAERNAIQEARRTETDIYNDLYRYESQGFREAIEKAEDLLKRPGHENNAQVWAHLAAAYGQAARWEAEHPSATQGATIADYSTEAFNAAVNAIKHGPARKPLLQLLWDPNHPAKRESGQAREENDLEVFYGDERFKKLLGS